MENIQDNQEPNKIEIKQAEPIKELNQNEIKQSNPELNETDQIVPNEKTDIPIKENKESDEKDGVFSRSEYAKKDFWNDRFKKFYLTCN